MRTDEEIGAHRVQAAQAAAVDGVPEGQDGIVVAGVLDDGVDPLITPGGFHNGAGIPHVVGHRFLAQHVATQLHGLNGHVAMGGGRGTVKNAFGFQRGKHGLQVAAGLRAGHAVAFLESLRAFGPDIRQADDFHILERLAGIGPYMGDLSATGQHHSETYFLLHAVPLPVPTGKRFSVGAGKRPPGPA